MSMFDKAGGFIDKAREAARQHPDQARSGIEKVEDLIDGRTGGKYADKVDQASAALQDKLGLGRGEGDPRTDTPPAQSPETPENPETPAGR